MRRAAWATIVMAGLAAAPSAAVDRRGDLERLVAASGGVGMVALHELIAREGVVAVGADRAVPPGCHIAPRAKAVIHLHMHGGPSQVDSFDSKPALAPTTASRRRPSSTACRCNSPTSGSRSSWEAASRSAAAARPASTTSGSRGVIRAATSG